MNIPPLRRTLKINVSAEYIVDQSWHSHRMASSTSLVQSSTTESGGSCACFEKKKYYVMERVLTQRLPLIIASMVPLSIATSNAPSSNFKSLTSISCPSMSALDQLHEKNVKPTLHSGTTGCVLLTHLLNHNGRILIILGRGSRFQKHKRMLTSIFSIFLYPSSHIWSAW